MKFRTAYDNEFGYSPGIDFMVRAVLLEPLALLSRKERAARLEADTGELVRDEGKTRQDMADDADINIIVKRYGLTGQLPVVRPKIPLEADFRNAGEFDLGAALRFVRAADAAFMAFPADIRSRFENDATKFVAFVEDPANKDECIRLGLLPKPVPPVVESKETVKA